MTRKRFASFSFLMGATPVFGLLCALATSARPSHAAPARPLFKSPSQQARANAPATSSAMTFDVTARITATGITKGPAQTINAQVALNGPKARVQTFVNKQPVVVLFTPPYVYRILPRAKSGVRWKVNDFNNSAMGSFDPAQLLRDPAQIRKMLLQSGAKKTLTANLKGVPTDLYEIKGVAGRIQGVKVWLRRADALPVRLVANGQGVQVVANWSSYARSKSLSSALFTPPANYHIRELRSAPPALGL